MNVQTNFLSILLSISAVIGGLALLTGGGELLVAGAVRLARRWGLSPLLIGLTVVAFGTSMPELFVGLLAVWQGYPDIMAGNVVGSNIANVGLILGVSALLAPLPVRFKAIALELYLMLAAGLGLVVISWFGIFSRLAGLFCLMTLFCYTAGSYRSAMRSGPRRQDIAPTDGADTGTKSCLPSYGSILLPIIGGFVLLAVGSKYFIDGAVDVARFFGVSELVIGLTLAAVGTSMPELASSLAAVRRNQSGLLVGNIVGSNLFNLLMVMGCAAMVRPFALPEQFLGRDLPVMIGMSGVLIPLLARHHRIERRHGVFFLLAYGCYIILLA